jgi:hypothetical protein
MTGAPRPLFFIPLRANEFFKSAVPATRRRSALKTKKRCNIDDSLTIFYAWRALFVDALALMAIRFVPIHYLTAVRALPPATFAHNFVKLLLMCQPCDVQHHSPRRLRSMLNINVICYVLGRHIRESVLIQIVYKKSEAILLSFVSRVDIAFSSSSSVVLKANFDC